MNLSRNAMEQLAFILRHSHVLVPGDNGGYTRFAFGDDYVRLAEEFEEESARLFIEGVLEPTAFSIG